MISKQNKKENGFVYHGRSPSSIEERSLLPSLVVKRYQHFKWAAQPDHGSIHSEWDLRQPENQQNQSVGKSERKKRPSPKTNYKDAPAPLTMKKVVILLSRKGHRERLLDRIVECSWYHACSYSQQDLEVLAKGKVACFYKQIEVVPQQTRAVNNE